ncbi:MAG: UDP-N-acetylglucosamine 1-carboxyvinyltransferase [Gammaproteobacteria bacterium]|nr:UDP-N-acetylglucosamine 1-carboxyvinyltransferase [Gammaproteobacteria bacterium]MYF02701.1 UDP-N-acetylglucosamine 1-carboxyvinyltransferase [Gammaproteobacteria bacterium]MYI77010.1 UDP-N-acetylglucosamine 1-carboxyvinyltransferase [Gammaproteobacteria bacterium]
MDSLRIRGGTPLEGELRPGGSKNATLPILAATLLSSGLVDIRNVPEVRDVTLMLELLDTLGAEIETNGNGRVSINTSEVHKLVAPYDLVRKMRASFLVLGPLLARFGRVEVSLPGGCAIGSRPVDQHLKALRKLGATIDLAQGYVTARCSDRLQGADIEFDVVTVGGTQNVMMAATLADGTTRMKNAAKEPEVVELADCLRSMGALISGDGTDCITVIGQQQLHSGGCTVSADRIEVGTFLAAAAATHGRIRIVDSDPLVLETVLETFRKFGTTINIDGSTIELSASHCELKATDIVTDVYPGIPTDLQAQFLALNCVSSGSSRVIETVFENRFMHVQELVRLGANASLESPTIAVIQGVHELRGATVMATDLRASSSLVIGALVAEGISEINRIYHLDRGYERIEEKLQLLGADVERVSAH